jgi:predicted nucleic acid-binding protein
MSGKCFVDTDILIYAHDRSAGGKHLRAQMLLEQLWVSGWGVISTQVIEELCVHFCRNAANPLPIEEVCLLIRDYSTWEVVPHTPASIQDTMDLVQRHKIPFADALILEAAERSGASILYSEHLSTMQRYGALQVVNPLIDSATATAASTPTK